jgi:hypothetical protein
MTYIKESLIEEKFFSILVLCVLSLSSEQKSLFSEVKIEMITTQKAISSQYLHININCYLNQFLINFYDNRSREKYFLQKFQYSSH